MSKIKNADTIYCVSGIGWRIYRNGIDVEIAQLADAPCLNPQFIVFEEGDSEKLINSYSSLIEVLQDAIKKERDLLKKEKKNEL